MKRIRSTNFSKEEELLLAEEVRKWKNIIENKTTNKISYKEKEQAWEQVLLNFNSKTNKRRELDQIKSKYDNLKTKARKQASLCKSNWLGTGGGPGMLTDIDDPILKIILEIISIKTVIGLGGAILDSDRDKVLAMSKNESSATCSCDGVGNLCTTGQNEIDLSAPDTINILGRVTSCKLDGHAEKDLTPIIIEPSTSSFSQPIITLKPHNMYVCDLDPVPATITSPTLAEAVISEHQAPASSKTLARKTANIGKKVENTPTKRIWNDYTPRNLKEPVNKKLRPTVPNPIYAMKQEYYRQKIDYMKMQQEEFEREKIRSQEKHEKQTQLLDIEIKIKTQELLKKLERLET